VRLFVFARHAESTLNHENRINGDPAVPAPLTERGREEARLLGLQVRELPLYLCLHTRFERTAETAAIAMAGRRVPVAEEPLFDDVRIGELEGQTVEDYRAWKRAHTRSDPFPGGESLDETARRYAAAFRALVERPIDCCLVVCHEIPIRYALNAAAGSDDLDGPVHAIPNAIPFLVDEAALERAIPRIERLSAESETRSPR
jgi:broad specificity phosphatase PhoE